MVNYKIKSIAFSLIELMIVIAIIGVLASIAIPSYESYTIKAKVTEGLNILDQLKTKSVDYYNQNAMLPGAGGGSDNGLTDLNVNSLSYSTSNIASINITSSGAIQVLYTGVVPSVGSGSAILNLVPTVPTAISGGSGASNVTTSIIQWQCGSASIIQSYLPGGCTFSGSFPG
ncbi:MAG: pilin [Gammaproteobacteria bacterium]|jgi:prepilin-type N-terminal cleavage/methylation domain-containing protein